MTECKRWRLRAFGKAAWAVLLALLGAFAGLVTGAFSSAFLGGICVVYAAPAAEDPLRRRADWGMAVAPPLDANGARIAVVRPNSSAAEAGLAAEDRIIAVNGVGAGSPAAWLAEYRRLRAGDRMTLLVRRATQERSVALTAAALPHEKIAGRVVEYGSVVSAHGHRVRTVTSRPPDAPGRLPVIAFVPWLSCDSIEAPRGATDGWSRMLNTVAAGVDALFVRVDKPGVGDSEGDCSETSLEDDLAAYRAAIRAALARTDADPSRLVLLGGSIGGALAPLLAREFDVRAIAVAGGFSRTWSEHMLGHERRRLTLAGGAPAAVNAAMRGFVDFYALYLDSRLTPAEVLARRPDLEPLWYDAPEHQYGRHARYFHEVQAQNVEAAWDAVRVPTLVVWGEFDWIMGRADQERIVEIINAHNPGAAKLVVVPGMNHHFERFADPVTAFREVDGRYATDATDMIVAWLRANM